MKSCRKYHLSAWISGIWVIQIFPVPGQKAVDDDDVVLHGQDLGEVRADESSASGDADALSYYDVLQLHQTSLHAM